MNKSPLSQRKDDHLDIVLAAGSTSHGVDAGWSALRFEHCALPEMALEDVNLGTELFGMALRAPLLISSMTGGAERARFINQHLAEAAQALGLAMGVGSQRVSLRSGQDQGLTTELRRLAPDVPLLANLGAAQLREADGVDLARRAVDTLDASALIIHLNPLQEAVQPEGDRNWNGVLACIEHVARQLRVPIIVKEVGAGISPSVARQLCDAGVSMIDVAGAGGTSWAAVEAERANDPAERAVAMAFSGWGIPTAHSLLAVRRAVPTVGLIASGGVRDGVDAAKAIRLGADLVGQAAGVLTSAMASTEAVVSHFDVIIRQLRIACFCTGSATLAHLRRARLVNAQLDLK
ncbi:type 2 isopentenyl-diphosphate Delta-isomerase [Pseudomonas fulva]|uniref:type 2 isopentenyl-diphosphate Delta-isomerase n=1 Tax=Pseudomonas fulva TaxID=47880 RepID=UPI0018A8FC98|nr:type 2 isopentenyl-diphosphate Delta-isomerase [Pseudomonas fulva]MBF8674385.1 type 2 isopentenyl-diphosphate Delta-isomerase [Pseudomonas fulva]MBF8696044.1 type 2 isopentenyl-diphosphate Delta-isomerase [Pseudomonas fulva]